MKDKTQISLIDELGIEENWKEEWQDMPEFIQEDLSPIHSIIVNFNTRKDFDLFSKLINQKLTYKTRSIWYPEAEIGRTANKRYSDES